jgi:phage pi2 protein 07
MKRRRYFSRKDNLKYTLLLGVVIALIACQANPDQQAPVEEWVVKEESSDKDSTEVQDDDERSLTKDTLIGDLRLQTYGPAYEPEYDKGYTIVSLLESVQDTLFNLDCCNWCSPDLEVLNRAKGSYLRTDCSQNGGGNNLFFIGLFSLDPETFLDTIVYKKILVNSAKNEFWRDTVIPDISSLTIQEISLHTDVHPILEVTDSQVIYRVDTATYRWYYHPSEEDEFLSTYDTLSFGQRVEFIDL